ncbi:MAG: PIN domain-containing protein [Verrucomicrobiales bacterium]
MTYLLDTDTVIYLMRGLKIAEAKSARQQHWQAMGQRIFDRARKREAAGHEMALSAVTVAELEFGARKSCDYTREVDVVHRVLTPFTLLDFDAHHCATSYGEVRHSLESAGKTIGSLDTLIAAHALAVGALLVTNNITHFGRVPGLKVESWVPGR